MPNITAEDLTERIDPALAVDRALTGEDRTRLTERVLVGPMSGAEPADWISEADNADAYLDIVEPWLRQRGEKRRDTLAARHELPTRLTHRIYVSALYACIGAGTADPNAPGAVYVLADRAALWARGYADALGWYPECGL